MTDESESSLRDRVTRVETKLASHEDHCSERYAQISTAVTAMEKAIASVGKDLGDKISAMATAFSTYQISEANNQIHSAKSGTTFERWIMRGLIVLLLIICGYLLSEGTPYKIAHSSEHEHEQNVH